MKYLFLIAGFIFLLSCSTKKTISTNSSSDITYIKKPESSPPIKESSPEKTISKPAKRWYYYSVLINRFETKKEAEKLVNEFKNQFPLLPITIRYEAPRYKVYTGVYNSEAEADKAALKLRSKYAGAFSVQFKN